MKCRARLRRSALEQRAIRWAAISYGGGQIDVETLERQGGCADFVAPRCKTRLEQASFAATRIAGYQAPQWCHAQYDRRADCARVGLSLTAQTKRAALVPGRSGWTNFSTSRPSFFVLDEAAASSTDDHYAARHAPDESSDCRETRLYRFDAGASRWRSRNACRANAKTRDARPRRSIRRSRPIRSITSRAPGELDEFELGRAIAFLNKARHETPMRRSDGGASASRGAAVLSRTTPSAPTSPRAGFTRRAGGGGSSRRSSARMVAAPFSASKIRRRSSSRRWRAPRRPIP